MKSIPPLKLYLLKNPEFIWCQLISINLCSVQFWSSTKIPVSNEEPFLWVMVSISIMTASDKMIRFVSQHPHTSYVLNLV